MASGRIDGQGREAILETQRVNIGTKSSNGGYGYRPPLQSRRARRYESSWAGSSHSAKSRSYRWWTVPIPDSVNVDMSNCLIAAKRSGVQVTNDDRINGSTGRTRPVGLARTGDETE